MTARLDNSGTRDGLTTLTWWDVDRSHEPRLTVGATPLVDRCILSYGWSEEFALKVLAGYGQFLGWKIMFVDWDAKKLSPSIAIDQMWHQHILDNRNYAEDCQLLYGKIVYHDPDGGLDVEAHRKRIANTKAALNMRYGEDYDREVWNFGSSVDEGTTRGTKRTRSPDNSTGSRTVSPAVDQSVSPSPDSNEPIIIRVRGKIGQEIYFKINKTSQMEKLFTCYAHQKGVPCSSLTFQLHGETIDPNATPQMLELGDMDQIDAVGRSSAPTLDDNETVLVRIRDQFGERVDYRLNKTTRMGFIFERYAQQNGVRSTSLRFLYDFERLDYNCTPLMLDFVGQVEIDVMPEQSGC